MVAKRLLVGQGLEAALNKTLAGTKWSHHL